MTKTLWPTLRFTARIASPRRPDMSTASGRHYAKTARDWVADGNYL